MHISLCVWCTGLQMKKTQTPSFCTWSARSCIFTKGPYHISACFHSTDQDTLIPGCLIKSKLTIVKSPPELQGVVPTFQYWWCQLVLLPFKTNSLMWSLTWRPKSNNDTEVKSNSVLPLASTLFIWIVSQVNSCGLTPQKKRSDLWLSFGTVLLQGPWRIYPVSQSKSHSEDVSCLLLSFEDCLYVIYELCFVYGLLLVCWHCGAY